MSDNIMFEPIELLCNIGVVAVLTIV